jgi:hypothetical protein
MIGRNTLAVDSEETIVIESLFQAGARITHQGIEASADNARTPHR